MTVVYHSTGPELFCRIAGLGKLARAWHSDAPETVKAVNAVLASLQHTLPEWMLQSLAQPYLARIGLQPRGGFTNAAMMQLLASDSWRRKVAVGSDGNPDAKVCVFPCASVCLSPCVSLLCERGSV